jgi:hypothetical protein
VADINRDGVLDAKDIGQFLVGNHPTQTSIYVGGPGGLWSNPASWLDGMVPNAASDAVVTDAVIVDVPLAQANNVFVIPGGSLMIAEGMGLQTSYLRAYDGGSVMLAGATSSITVSELMLDGLQPLAWSAGTINVADDGQVLLNGAALEIGQPDGDLATLQLGVRAGVTAAGGVQLNPEGELAGDGVIQGHFDSNGALTPQPRMTINGGTTFAADNRLRVELRADGCDFVRLDGDATLGGTLDVTLADGFTPAPGATFLVLHATGAAISGFHTVNLPAIPTGVLRVEYQSDRVLVVCDPP